MFYLKTFHLFYGAGRSKGWVDQLDQLVTKEHTAGMATSAAIKPRATRKLKANAAGRKPALQVNIYEAKTQLSSLVQRAANGEEIVIAKAGQPLARIVAMPEPEKKPERRKFGQNFLGITYMAPDWDAPMTEEELAKWGL